MISTLPMVPVLQPEIVNMDEVAQDMARIAYGAEDALERAMDVAGAAQRDRFRQEQMSGRTAGDMGLNVVSGNLRESLRYVTIVEEQKMTSEIYNRGGQYWYPHQEGEGVKKRLMLEEDLEARGLPLYESEIERGLNELLQGA